MVESFVDQSDWPRVRDWLLGLGDDDMVTARKWYRGSLRARARRVSQFAWRTAPRAVQLGMAFVLAETAEEASKNCGWTRDFCWTDDQGLLPEVTGLLMRRDESFVAEVGELASQLAPRGESRRGAGELAGVLLGAAALNASVPVGGAIAQGWAQLVSAAGTVSTHDRAGTWVPVRWGAPERGAWGPAYKLPSTLYDVLKATPRLAEVMSAALGHPETFIDWPSDKSTDWDTARTVSRLVDEGTLDRDALVAETLAALTRPEKPGAQRVMANILSGAGFGPADVLAHDALVAHLMASAHGSVTATLLPAVLKAGLPDPVLIEIGTVILARKEKAQKRLLIKALSRSADAEASVELLQLAATDDDATLAKSAQAALGSDHDGSTPSAAWAPGWNLDVEGLQHTKFVPWSATRAGIDEARSDSANWVRVNTNAAWLDLAVRFGRRNSDELKTTALGWEPESWGPRIPGLIREWAEGNLKDPDWDELQPMKSIMFKDGEQIEKVTYIKPHRPPGYVQFSNALARESLRRIGEVDELLSTPSCPCGLLSLDDLHQRLRRSGRAGAAPYDLVQALLRLERVPTSEAKRFSAMGVPLGGQRKSRFRRLQSGELDAGQIVHDWIQQGGLPDRRVEIRDGHPVSAAVEFPLPRALRNLEGVGALEGAIEHPLDRERGLWYGTELLHFLGVVPRWSELAGVLLEYKETSDSIFRAKEAALLTHSAGEFGPGTHHLIGTLQSHPRADARAITAQLIVDAARQGRLDRDLLCEQTMEAWRNGDLSAKRLADTWTHVATLGAFAWVWPTAAAVMTEACTGVPKRTGLADLLRALAPMVGTGLAHEPNTALVSALRALAAERGNSKAVAEARIVVGALGGLA